MVVTYFETGFRYIDNVRFFKENDPYFYKVDNIPLKQFDENIKFLKDQTDGILQQVSKKPTLGREGFTELQPYVDGFDSLVKVRPGRYTARVNDAYSISKLQSISQFIGEGSNIDGNTNGWDFNTASHPDQVSIMENWHSKLSTNATNMNGLYERTFVYPTESLDTPGSFTDTTDPDTFSVGNPMQNRSPYPAYTGTNVLHTIDLISRGMQALTDGATQGLGLALGQLFKNAGRLEAEFIRRWRGVTRTAIVDVPEDLAIEIPPFDAADFFYTDALGDKQTVTAAQRIDLLFIYSKPIDQPETTLASYTNGAPRTINAPVLGIVKGAGIGVSQQTATNSSNMEEAVKLQNIEGVTLMLPNPSDELSSDTGFSLSSGPVRGSFPSPDDLMNLAPLISEKLESTATPLIGQSILPVAYIVVKAIPGTTAEGTPIITANDVIDIRPLLRTTELAYNERAGIAAASPQISIANPVVSENFVENVSRDIVQDYNAKVDGINTKLALGQPRIVAAGSIKGGMYYGVEGALASYVRTAFNVTEYEQAKNIVENRYFYPNGSIPDFPDWDLAQWCVQGNYTGKGTFPNDRVDYYQYGMNTGSNTTSELLFGPFSQRPVTAAGVPVFDPGTNPRIGKLGVDKLARWGSNVNNIVEREGANAQYYVSKTITIDKDAIPWAADYFVNVQLWNCVPMSCRTSQSPNNVNSTSLASSSDIWVDRRENSFTIYVSWVANDPLDFVAHPEQNSYGNSLVPSDNRNDGGKYAGFSVVNKDIQYAGNPNYSADAPSSNAGVAIYPTVTFQIVGIPQQARNNSANLNGNNPTITLT